MPPAQRTRNTNRTQRQLPSETPENPTTLQRPPPITPIARVPALPPTTGGRTQTTRNGTPGTATTTSDGGLGEEEVEGEEGDEDEEEEEGEPSAANSPSRDDPDAYDPTLIGLRSLLPLAHILLSTSKPTNGVSSLLSPNPKEYWQSDGPQPHTIHLHFFKLVSITRLRLYLDFHLDESYTPTRIAFFAGFSTYDLIEVGEWHGETPSGWVEMPLEGVGGGRGGYLGVLNEEETNGGDKEPREKNELRCMVLQVRILENHQNGKDTHVRGIQIWGKEERGAERRAGGKRKSIRKSLAALRAEEALREEREKGKVVPLEEAEWMGDAVLR
ncbi:MAG: anaphase promoting complex subunit doc1 [Cirrosporium novae-zelandiae]|nr:MAG: anaphase promoting complex subunit doc1 [Cirrosporium novae-zelandiae]